MAIADAINTLNGTGLWDEQDGFYYDHARVNGRSSRLPFRSMVGLIPLLAVEVLDDEAVNRLPSFRKRMQWFLDNRRDLAGRISCFTSRRSRPQWPPWPYPRGRGWSVCCATCWMRTNFFHLTASVRFRAYTAASPACA